MLLTTAVYSAVDPVVGEILNELLTAVSKQCPRKFFESIRNFYGTTAEKILINKHFPRRWLIIIFYSTPGHTTTVTQ